ncbi:O-antigen ligase family protein [Bacillus nitratireducens]|uniref:O-antigen ligase family protein n=1 Tax=Bacillus nitratireducens TaxID=2026193 RepID=UPI001F598DDC|nr:O-antigen ligase family protein [Bacillus nitratireducens]UNP76365.1 O-antigen ligase family protein [Bacillus nitratireducens]
MKIDKNIGLTTVYILTITPFIGIGGINALFGSATLDGFKVLSVLISIILLVRKGFLKYDFFSVCFALYQMEIFLVTTCKYGFSFGILTSCLAATLFVFLMISDWEHILKAISIITAVIVIINFISVLQIGRDDYAMYFVGTKNRLSMVLIPAILLRVVYTINKYGKIDYFTVVLFILAALSVIIAGSGTGIVVAALAVVLAVLFYRFRVNKMIVLCGVFALYFLLLVCSNVLAQNQYWIEFTTFLGKDSNLTYRTIIWKGVFDYLSSSPLFGLGRGSEIIFSNAYGGYNIVTEAHNFVVEIFLEGGIVAFFLYTIGFIKAISRINTKDLKGKYVLLAVVMVLVNGLTESINNHLLVVLTIALANSYVYMKSKGSKHFV